MGQPLRLMSRISTVLALVTGLLVVSAGRVAACDCAMTELPRAVAAADVAIVGTLVGRSAPAQAKDERPVEQMWTWAIERSRDPVSAVELTVMAWEDDGASCGVSFGPDERWLVIADLEGGHLRTNGCLPNRQIGPGADPEVDAVVKAMLPVSGPTAPSEPAALTVPGQLMGVVIGLGVVGVASLWAFRRERAR